MGDRLGTPGAVGFFFVAWVKGGSNYDPLKVASSGKAKE